MKTFKIAIAIEGKLTIPESLLKELRNMAAEEPADGGPMYLHQLHKDTYEDDDAFLQGALKHALRNIARHGVATDLGGLGDGIGVRVAPPTVTVSVPESVITKVKARSQLAYAGELPVGGGEHGGDYKAQTEDITARIGGTEVQHRFKEIEAAARAELAAESFGQEGALEQADPDA